MFFPHHVATVLWISASLVGGRKADLADRAEEDVDRDPEDDPEGADPEAGAEGHTDKIWAALGNTEQHIRESVYLRTI